MINPFVLEFNEDGTIVEESFGAEFGNSATTPAKWYGNEGDDVMWGRKQP